MLGDARRGYGPEAQITSELEEELRAMKATSGMTAYEQFTWDVHR